MGTATWNPVGRTAEDMTYMVVDDGITPGEIARRLDGFEQRTSAQFDGINRRLDNLQFVPRDTYLVQIDSMTERITGLEERARWFSRALVTAILFPVLTALILALVLTR